MRDVIGIFVLTKKTFNDDDDDDRNVDHRNFFEGGGDKNRTDNKQQ